LLVFTTFFGDVRVAMHGTTDADAEFFYVVGEVGFLDFPDVVVVTYTSCYLVFIFNEGVFVFELNYFSCILVLAIM